MERSSRGDLRCAHLTLHIDLYRQVIQNEYEGSTQTVTVSGGGSSAVSWPTDPYGYYDVIITANTADGFRRRYAGRIA